MKHTHTFQTEQISKCILFDLLVYLHEWDLKKIQRILSLCDDAYFHHLPFIIIIHHEVSKKCIIGILNYKKNSYFIVHMYIGSIWFIYFKLRQVINKIRKFIEKKKYSQYVHQILYSTPIWGA